MLLFRFALAIALSAGLSSAGWADDQEQEHSGDCQCTAVDYADAGSYLVNANTDGNFSFATRFEGNCVDSEITSVLRDPDNHVYDCSAMRPGMPGSIQISECDVEYLVMKSGRWQIVINLPANVTVSRTFTLTVGAPSTVVTTITPTVIIGTTSTLPASTIIVTTHQTSTLTLPASTLTTPCTAPKTLKTTVRGLPTLIIETQVVLQLTTDGTTTTSATTTSVLTASCRYSSSFPTRSTTAPTVRATSSTARVTASSSKITTVTVTAAPTAPAASGAYSFTLSGSSCVIDLQNVAGSAGWGPPWRGGRGGGPPPWITSLWQGGPPPLLTAAGAAGTLPPWVSCVKIATKTRRAEGVRIAAFTSTVVQTTYTETQVTTSFLPAETVTRYVIETAIQTITPAPGTLCVVAPDVTEVVTAPGPELTQITLVTSTSHVTETVFITQTFLTISNDMAAATSCWQNGGSYGVQP